MKSMIRIDFQIIFIVGAYLKSQGTLSYGIHVC